MTIRVGILFEFPSLNGGEHSMLSVVRQLRDTFDFHALAPESGPLANALAELQIPHTPFSVRDTSGTKRPADEILIDLEQHQRTLKTGILHANSLSMARLTGQLKNNSCRTGHLRDIMRLNRSVVSDLNHNKRLVAVSQAVRDFHHQQGLDAARCEVIYNGVDIEAFRPAQRTDRCHLISPAIGDEDFVVLSVGQICLRKGQQVTAQAVCELLKHRTDIHLVIVGERFSAKQESRDYEDSLRQIFAAAGVSEHLHLLGYRDDIPQLMNAADLLVHSAHQEPFGRVLLEAASSGLPIIATDVGGTAEMLHDGVEATLVRANESGDLAAAIRQAMDSPARLQRLASSARQRICDSFTIKIASQQLADFWSWVSR